MEFTSFVSRFTPAGVDVFPITEVLNGKYHYCSPSSVVAVVSVIAHSRTVSCPPFHPSPSHYRYVVVYILHIICARKCVFVCVLRRTGVIIYYLYTYVRCMAWCGGYEITNGLNRYLIEFRFNFLYTSLKLLCACMSILFVLITA